MASEKEIKDWYNQRHRSFGEQAWRPKDAYPSFLDYLNVVPGKKLLDIGCGTGYLLKAADQRGLETYGVDISDEGVKIAKHNSPNSRIMVGKGEELVFPANSFDYVTCLGALEHFLGIEKGVQEMARVAKSGALFCVVVPNVNFLYWKIRGTKGTKQQDINENLLSLDQWRDVFAGQGLETLRVHQDDWPVRKLGTIKRALFRVVWTFLPLQYTYQFVFVLRKR